MSLQLRARSNPVAWWWGLLTLVGSANIALWFWLYREFQKYPADGLGGKRDGRQDANHERGEQRAPNRSACHCRKGMER